MRCRAGGNTVFFRQITFGDANVLVILEVYRAGADTEHLAPAREILVLFPVRAIPGV